MQADAAVDSFMALRTAVSDGTFGPDLTSLKHFATWFREPDFSADYRELFDLELRLNGGVNVRSSYELLSAWRLARDPSYGLWAREQGVERCQLTLFGMRATTDWFYRREGAFDDILLATDRLLECGIAPRWQLFLTNAILPELQDLLELANDLRLADRCDRIGNSFVMFMHDPTPVGEARSLEKLRPVSASLCMVPESLQDATRKHMGMSQLYATEAEWISKIQAEDDRPVAADVGPASWLYVDQDGNVYPNHVSLEPWWRVGNLRMDAPGASLQRYLTDGTPALRAQGALGRRELCRLFGNPGGDKVYMSSADLLALYLERHLESVWARSNDA